MRYKSILNIEDAGRKAAQVIVPLYDPLKDAKQRQKKTRQKSAYDVARSDRKDLLIGYKEEAKVLYPNDESKQQGYVNKCYTDLVKDNKDYWEERAKQVNEVVEDDSEEEEDGRDERKR